MYTSIINQVTRNVLFTSFTNENLYIFTHFQPIKFWKAEIIKIVIKLVMSLLFELPVLSTHGTLLLLLLWVEPLHYTVYMKAVSALSPHQGAVIPRCATVRATCFKWHPTYTTCVVIRYPLPCSDCCPVLDLYFHGDLLWIIRGVSLKQGKQIVSSVICKITDSNSTWCVNSFIWFYLRD